jgi:hypothetical protein
MLVNAQSSRDRSRQTFAPWSRFQPLRVLHKVAINLGRRLNSISPQPPTALSDRLHSSDCAIDTLVSKCLDLHPKSNPKPNPREADALKSATILCQVIPQLYSYASLASPYQFLWLSQRPLFISLGCYTSQLSASASVTNVHIQNQSFLSGRFRTPVCSTYRSFFLSWPPVRKKTYVLRRALSSLLVFVVMFHPRLFVVLHLHFSHVVRANLASTMTCIQT